MRKTTLAVAVLAGLTLGPSPDAIGAAGTDLVRIAYLYNLSNFGGVVPYSDVILHVDRARDEVYSVVGNSVRVFNSSGMETYRFDHDLEDGQIFDLVVLESDEIYLLIYERTLESSTDSREWWITRSDYRGKPIERLEITGMPEELLDFGPNAMFYQGGQIILASRSQLLAVRIDTGGAFLDSYDLASLAQLDDSESNDIFGLDLDPEGNILFTIPTRFRAYVVSTSGEVRQWGLPGSAPGKFGIVSGIVADDYGNILIADKLRNVVMVFDKRLAFLTEFFAAGERILSRPTDIVMGEGGKFYVTQSQDRGVAVFRLTPLADQSPLQGERDGEEDTAPANESKHR